MLLKQRKESMVKRQEIIKQAAISSKGGSRDGCLADSKQKFSEWLLPNVVVMVRMLREIALFGDVCRRWILL